MNIKREPRGVGISSQLKFIRDTSLFSTSLVLGGFCGIIRAFFLAKLLGPQAFGTWRFINIFLDYIGFASLGTQPAIHQRIPFLRGKGDLRRLQDVLSTAFATGFFSSILYGFLVFGCSLFVEETVDARALAAFSPVILLLGWLYYVTGLSMATGLYGLRSWIEALHAFTTLLFSVTLVYYWGVYGAIAGLGISSLITVLLSSRRLWDYSAFKIKWKILYDLIVTGLPMMINGMLLTTMGISDKILIAALLNRELLGVYGVGSAAVSILGTIPSSIGQMLVVKFSEMDGQNRTKQHISDVLDNTTLVLSSLFAPIISLAIVCFPLAVVFLLPDYVAGIAAGRLLIAATFFLGISLPVTNWCISTGRFVPVLGLRLVILAVEFAAVYIVIHKDGRLESIALCVLFAFALFSALMVVICNHLLEKRLLDGLIRAVKSFLPFIGVLMAILVQDNIYSSDILVPGIQLFVSSFLGLVISIALGLPFIYWANRQTHLARLIFKRVSIIT